MPWSSVHCADWPYACIDGSSITVPPASRTLATAASTSATVHIGTVTDCALPPATPAHSQRWS